MLTKIKFFDKIKLKGLYCLILPVHIISLTVGCVAVSLLLINAFSVLLSSRKDNVFDNLDKMISTDYNMGLLVFIAAFVPLELPITWVKHLATDPYLFFSPNYEKVTKLSPYSKEYVLGCGILSTFLTSLFLYKSTVLQSSKYFYNLTVLLFLCPLITIFAMYVLEYYKKWYTSQIQK